MLEPPSKQKSNFAFLNGLINWTSTYSDESALSDIAIPYGKHYLQSITPIMKQRLPTQTTTRNLLQQKRRKVAWFVHKCRLPLVQTKVVDDLQRAIPVDVYGPYGLW